MNVKSPDLPKSPPNVNIIIEIIKIALVKIIIS